ncbi:hypothetical protein KAFR_0G03090 [Kazachstania africana CBS 2517]|uniref:BED-type domain-containing protein n=1 Tax=Kazachstania africana (strain ATCC 22294 / BCRC 22015 / CBS 2517 / CECT 1963 / NBRC 1671 / NRRL Y-8276) TaxID=1071382 RepID=H2AY91_KAZAF|nr:hypothetical protein KAFR_0G03090 [Kazachstania africana CBS 2517]CCF59341.1 hypothetical protein KAFR_0G03090 [Kazachstania africana CBS 2517]
MDPDTSAGGSLQNTTPRATVLDRGLGDHEGSNNDDSLLQDNHNGDMLFSSGNIEITELNADPAIPHSTVQDGSENNIEMIIEGGKKWLPIYLLSSSHSTVWTHYLSLNKSLKRLKCKHCGEIINRKDSVNVSNTNMKKYKWHLESVHNKTVTSNYYSTNSTKLPYKIQKRNGRKLILSPIDNLESYFIFQRRKTTGPVGHLNFLQDIHDDKVLYGDGLADLRKDVVGTIKRGNNDDEHDSNSTQTEKISKELLFTSLIVNENLPLSFSFNPMFQLLIKDNIQKNEPPSRNVIEKTIRSLTKSITRMVNDELRNSNLSFPLKLDLGKYGDTVGDWQKMHENELLMTEMKELFLKLFKSNLFTANQAIYGKDLLVTSVQFHDSESNSNKVLPISIHKLNSVVSTHENSIEKFIESKLSEALFGKGNMISPGISVTLANNLFTSDVESSMNSAYMAKSSKVAFRRCITNVLVNSVGPFYGHHDTEGSGAISSNQFAINGKEKNKIDYLINLTHVNISSSIFGKINSFYRELLNDRDLYEKFMSSCKVLKIPFNKNATRPFNKNFPSTSPSFLRQFLKFRQVVEKLEGYLHYEKFTSLDYDIVEIYEEFLSSINQLVAFLVSPIPNFQFVLLILVSIETYINNIMKSKDLKLIDKYGKPFEAFLKDIQLLKKNIVNDEDYRLALFYCPTTLYEKQLVRRTYQTVALQEVTEKINKMTLQVFEKFINLHSEPHVLIEEHISNPDKRTYDNKQGMDKYDAIALSDSNRSESGEEEDPGHPGINEMRKFLLNEINISTTEYLNSVNLNYPNILRAVVDQNQVLKYKENSGKFFNSKTGKILNSIDELIYIHIPASNVFLQQFKFLEKDNNNSIIFSFVLKYIQTLSASSLKSQFLFLNQYEPSNGNELFSEIIKLRIFNGQFNINKIDFERDSLNSICKYRS